MSKTKAEQASSSTEQEKLLQRVARELDRFTIALSELSNATSILMSAATLDKHSRELYSLQKLDYLMQCSCALSDLLVRLSQRENQDQVREIVKAVRPSDLSSRLLDLGLDDIDNTRGQFEIL